MLDYGKYITVADRYQHKAKRQDREDLRQDIILRLAQVARNNGHKPFTDRAMIRVASYVVADYWRTQYKITNGIDCGSCSKAQRRKCREDDLYRECPKAIKIESLSKPIIDSEGNITELGELIADDKAIDLDAWLDDKTFLLGFPKRLIGIGYKIRNGQALNKGEHCYLQRFRKKAQKKLF